MKKASVLVVEDNDLERQITAEILREEGFAVEEAASGKRALELLALGSFDVVLTDLVMPGMSGEELLATTRPKYPATQVVMVTAHGTIDSAVKAMKAGAFYYLTKPTDRETLVMTALKAAELANLQEENLLLRRRLEGKLQIEGIVGQDPEIEEVIKIVRKVAPSNSTVLIQGESGTGKEIIARSIHKLSPRGGAPVRSDQLLRDPRQSDRERAVRARTRRLHRRYRAQNRADRGGRQVNFVPRRNRRSRGWAAGQAVARAPGKRGPARGRQRILPR